MSSKNGSFALKSSPLWGFVAGVAVVFAIAGAVLASHIESEAQQRNIKLGRAIETLRRSNTELVEFNDDTLAKTRAQADLFRATLLNDARIAAFKQEQQDFWRVTETNVERTQDYKKVRIDLARGGSLMSDWSRVVETVQALQSTPGMTVRQIDILTTGDASQRVFERVTLGVTLFVRLADKK